MDYKVNTMTVTSQLGGSLSLSGVSGILERFGNDPCSTVTVPYQVAFRGETTVRHGGPVFKTNGHQRKFKKKIFNNQVTVIFQVVAEKEWFIHMKVFANGKTQMTGVRDTSYAKSCMYVLARYFAPQTLPSEPPIFVHMINAHCDVRKTIDRRALYSLIREAGTMVVSYQPEIHPAVKIGYYHNESGTGHCPKAQPCNGKEKDCCKKVTILAFHTGKIIFTGGNSIEQIEKAFHYIQTMLSSFLA